MNNSKVRNLIADFCAPVCAEAYAARKLILDDDATVEELEAAIKGFQDEIAAVVLHAAAGDGGAASRMATAAAALGATVAMLALRQPAPAPALAVNDADDDDDRMIVSGCCGERVGWSETCPGCGWAAYP